MTFETVKLKVADYHKNGQTITALYWLLKKFNLKVKNLKGFEFREAAKPDFILLTTEGSFGTPQIIKVPVNIFEFPLELMLSLLAHELVHVAQKTIKPFVLNKNEREWQAYYQMLFRQTYSEIPEIPNFNKRFFCNKAIDYYNLMGTNSVLQHKYAHQKTEVENLLKSIC